MTKFLLYLLCALLLLTDPGTAAAASADEAAAPTEAVATAGIPRPSYKRYRGNSRRKYRRNVFRRMGAKRRTRKKAKTAPRRGVITVDPPVRNQ